MINSEKGSRILELRNTLGLSQGDFAKKISVDRSNLSTLERGARKLGPNISFKITQAFGVNPRWLETGEGEMFLKESVQESNRPKIESNGEHFAYLPDPEDHVPTSHGNGGVTYTELGGGKYLMTIPVVDQYAFAGYLAGFADAEYLEDLPKVSIMVDKEYNGIYRGFRVRGESMTDGTADSIFDKMVVAGRQIEREFYDRNRLHLKKWRFYVVVTLEGILVKEILEHDVIAGTLQLRSLNPNKREYPDFTIRMEKVIEIYNIVKKEMSL